MIVYLDTSVIGRACIADEVGHRQSLELLTDSTHTLVTGSWARVELTSTLTRAGRGGRRLVSEVEHELDRDLGADGVITVLGWHQDLLEDRTIELVRRFAIRSMDALHLAYAELAALPVVPEGEKLGFATHDRDQAAAAKKLGFALV